LDPVSIKAKSLSKRSLYDCAVSAVRNRGVPQ
jgi:hypothetical protein